MLLEDLERFATNTQHLEGSEQRGSGGLGRANALDGQAFVAREAAPARLALLTDNRVDSWACEVLRRSVCRVMRATILWNSRSPPPPALCSRIRYGIAHALGGLGPVHRLPSQLVVNLLRACYRLVAVMAASDTATCWRVCRKLKLCDAVASDDASSGRYVRFHAP